MKKRSTISSHSMHRYKKLLLSTFRSIAVLLFIQLLFIHSSFAKNERTVNFQSYDQSMNFRVPLEFLKKKFKEKSKYDAYNRAYRIIDGLDPLINRNTRIEDLKGIQAKVNEIPTHIYNSYDMSYFKETLWLACEVELQKHSTEMLRDSIPTYYQTQDSIKYTQLGVEFYKKNNIFNKWGLNYILGAVLIGLFIWWRNVLRNKFLTQIQQKDEELKRMAAKIAGHVEELKHEKEKLEINRQHISSISEKLRITQKGLEENKTKLVEQKTFNNPVPNTQILNIPLQRAENDTKKQSEVIHKSEFFVAAPLETGHFNRSFKEYIPSVCLYKIKNIRAEFEFFYNANTFENDSKKEYLEPACEFTPDHNYLGKTVNTLLTGQIKLVEDGKWEVQTKSIIKFI